ncbi:MAG: lysylphosphatidylglycerol synthase transmembrane domain-containing protein, partial [Dermatophilaceae bacterium]
MNRTSITWRQVIRFVLGLGAAATLLGWGLPYFTGATWGEIWAEIRTVPLERAVGFQAIMLLGLYAYTLTLVGSLRGLTHHRALVL